MTTLVNLLRKAWRFNWLLTLAGLLHIVLIPILVIGLVVDPKVISGTNAWIKPLKFALSLPIYSFTLVWLLTYIQGRRRLVQIIASVTGAVAIIETVLIVLQVLRGTTSHFNVSTAVDAAIFSTMGTAITVLAVMNLLTVILLSLQRMGDPVFATALRLGVLTSFVGMVVAFLMTAGPTPSQLAALQAGGELTHVGAHSVGVEDGGPGLPLVGWSTVGGDLRVPHFVGLHGLQIVPLLGFLLTRPAARRRFREGQRTSLVWVAGIGYTGWTAVLTWQALRGQSVVAMDGQTALTYLILLGGMAVATGLTLLSQRPSLPVAATPHLHQQSSDA
jgi:hypothetical protein